MGLLSKLFGSKAKSPEPTKAVEYKDFRIFPEPIREGRAFRISARIELDVDGETKVHQLIRADTIESLDVAVEASTNKAKQMINEQGVRLFD